MKYKIKSLTISLLLFVLYAATYSCLLHYKDLNTSTEQVQHESFFEKISPTLLDLLACEFNGIVSSYIILDTGARLGTSLKRTGTNEYVAVQQTVDYNAINKLFLLSQSLDPAFAQSFQLAQGWLPWEGKMMEEAQHILKTAELHRPYDWEPLRFQAFNEYYFKNNPENAGKLMLKAGQVPNSPSFLPIVGARLMSQKGNDTLSAINLLKNVLESKKEYEPGFEDIQDRLNALYGVYIIEQSIKQYKKNFKRDPQDISELIQTGILATLPVNPYKVPFCIESDSHVSFDNPNCLTGTAIFPKEKE